MAEREGFEPSVSCPTPHFQCGAFVHSTISPRRFINIAHFICLSRCFFKIIAYIFQISLNFSRKGYCRYLERKKEIENNGKTSGFTRSPEKSDGIRSCSFPAWFIVLHIHLLLWQKKDKYIGTIGESGNNTGHGFRGKFSVSPLPF